MTQQISTTLSEHVQTLKGFAFKSIWYTNDGRPIVKVSDFTADSVDCSSLTCIPEDVANNYLRYQLREDDVVVQTVGSWPSNPASVVGKAVRIPKEASGALLNQNAVKLIPDDLLDKKYLFYLLRNIHFKNYIIGTAQGAASQAAITLDSIKRYSFSLYPLKTQHKIAAILSAYGDLIENNNHRIKILEEMARLIYHEWFISFRFPGHEKGRIVGSPLGKIPEGWEVKSLGALVKIRKGQNITKETIVEGQVPVVAGGIEPSYYHNVFNTQNPVITVSASGANAGFVNLYQEDVWASDCSVIDSKVTPYVYYYYLLLDQRRIEVTGLQRGSAQPHVYPKDLMALQAIEVPDYLLGRFNEEIAPIFRMIRNMKQRNSNLRQTRDLLLPKLISGEIDVSELDIAIKENAA